MRRWEKQEKKGSIVQCKPCMRGLEKRQSRMAYGSNVCTLQTFNWNHPYQIHGFMPSSKSYHQHRIDSRQLSFQSQIFHFRSLTCYAKRTPVCFNINNNHHHLSSDVQLEICSSTPLQFKNPLKLIERFVRVIVGEKLRVQLWKTERLSCLHAPYTTMSVCSKINIQQECRLSSAF